MTLAEPDEIMRIKFTEVQLHQIRTAHDNSAAVLRAIKTKSLKPAEFEAMKALEAAVQNLETLMIVGK